MSYILLIDAGNTNTKFALANGSGKVASYTLPTRPANTSDDWGFKLEDILRREMVAPNTIEACVISSVVPPLDPIFSYMVRRFLNIEAQFVPGDIPVNLENRYARPEQVGADVLVTALAARRQFDNDDLIVVDFGTATTLACVKKDAFMGGLICPGVLSSMSSLATGTAKLPAVDLKVESDQLHWGQSTSECLNQGLVFGFASMVEGLCERLKPQLGPNPLVVATGGFAPVINKVTDAIDEVVPDLLMEGLLLAYKESQE